MIYIKKISKSNNSKKNKLLKVIILSTLLSYNSIFSNICRASSNESEDILSILKVKYISMFEKKFLFKEKQIEETGDETEDKNSIELKPCDVIAKSGIQYEDIKNNYPKLYNVISRKIKLGIQYEDLRYDDLTIYDIMLMCEIKLEEFQKQNEYSLLYEISVFNSLPIRQYFPIGESSSIKAMSKNKMDEQFKELELLNGELLSAVNSSSLDMKYIMELINEGAVIENKESIEKIETSLYNNILNYFSETKQIKFIGFHNIMLKPNKKFKIVYDKSGSSHKEIINNYPIIIGIHFRAFDFVKTLISISGAKINNTDMENPLELVIEQVYDRGIISSDNGSEQNKNMMFYLIEHGASFQIKEENKNYIAYHAILEQNTIVLNKLLESYFNINSEVYYDKSRKLPLIHLAAEYNKLESLSLLIEKDSSVLEQKIKNGRTVLHQAVMGQSLDVIKLLIGIVNINEQDNFGYTPLHLAVKNNYHEIVDLLLSNGARFDIKTNNDDYTPLHFAVMHNAYESAKILIDYNSDINSKNIYEVPIIFTAMNYKFYEMTKLLIKNKVEVNYTYKENEVELNLLYLAVTKGFPLETIEFLFKKGIKGDILDYRGNNLLHLAIEYDSPIDIANFFIEQVNINVNSKNKNGDTPLYMVENPEMAKNLIEKGAEVSVDCIFRGKSYEISKFLIEESAYSILNLIYAAVDRNQSSIFNLLSSHILLDNSYLSYDITEILTCIDKKINKDEYKIEDLKKKIH